MSNIKKNHKAFTLAELMVCLAIISVIATLLMPAINKLRPNKNKVMFKKAYYLTERIISELVNDEEAYPFVEDKVGFDNTDEVTINGTTYGGSGTEANAKLCKLFALKMNTLSETPNCVSSADFDNPSFTTTDGVKWIMPYTDFADQATYYSIVLDVNGDNEPNCGVRKVVEFADPDNPTEAEQAAAAEAEAANNAPCPQPDRFLLGVRPDGKMVVNGAIAREYIGTTNMIENKK